MKSKEENKKTFDEVIKIAVQPKERTFTALLNDKQSVYPKQPRGRKEQAYLKEEIGISIVGFNTITISFDKAVLGDRIVQIKLLKSPKRNEMGVITQVLFSRQDISEQSDNPCMIQLSKEDNFKQIIFELEKSEDSHNTSDVNLQVSLTY